MNHKPTSENEGKKKAYPRLQHTHKSQYQSDATAAGLK